MAMALQHCSAAAAAMATVSSSSAQVFLIGRASSPPCCCCCSSSSSSSSVSRSYGGGRLLGRRRRSQGSSPTGRMQEGGVGRRNGGGIGIGVGNLKDAGGVGRIWSTEEAEDGKRVVLSRAFGGGNGDGGGEGDPLYFVGEDFSSGDGPIELPPREIEIDPFAIPEASPAQVVASIFLTGAIVALSYRALRKRAARSKDMQFRSTGISPKSIKEEARKTVIDNLTKVPEVPTPLPSPFQTLFGAIVAGVIALGLYKFTSSVEAGFSVKAVSQDYSIRNLTITVRTIITGLCYLATFVFAANSVGLTLYAFQLLLGIGVPETPNPTDSFQQESKTEEKLETEDLSE